LPFNISRSSSLPLHLQLLDELRHQIKSGQLKPHDRLPGEWELVEALEISRATIQRAWQAAQDEGLIYRVTGKGTFVAAPQPFNVREVIGFFIPEYRGTFAVQMLNGAERVLRQHSYRVQFASTDRSIEEENRLLRLLMDDGALGCILVPSQGKITGRLLTSPEFNLPVVLMDRPMNGIILPCVTSNNYEGGLQAMEHLIGLGHRRIIFFARPHLNLWTVSERYRAYRDMMHRHDSQPEPPLLVGGSGEMSSYEAYLENNDAEIQPLVELLKSTRRPTAIFAVNDWMALKVQRAIMLAGLRNPHDVSVVGFDDLDIAQYQSPPLTTVAQNSALMGAEAARRLITRLEGAENEGILTLVPTRLVVRGSTAPPP
jgi:GntR family transcriptional regulator, arabinose operon transcriptional repressor